MIRTIVRLLVIIVPFAAAQNHRSHAQEVLRTAADRPVDVEHIKLDLEVFLKEKRIAGAATIRLKSLRPVRSIRLDAIDFEVNRIREPDGDRTLNFENTGKELVVDLGRELPRGAGLTLEIVYQVRKPTAGLYFFGPTESDPNVPWTVWSQGETIESRHWFPCFDHPNELQTTETVITAEAGFDVLSNGKLLRKESIDGGKKVRFHWSQSQPHVAYLVTLVVGKFAVGATKWGDIPVLYYGPTDRQKDLGRTFNRTPEMLEFFSNRFGIRYPWDKYAQAAVEQFNWGGMENTSATTLTELVMHDERSLIDGNPDWLIAHELGHQWWGDLLTCKDWSHLWLNEGFATFCELLWAEHKLGKDEFEYLLLQKSRTARDAAAKARPVVDRYYPNSMSMFDSRSYPKGGWILHMLRRRLGDEQFFEGVKRYGTTFRHQSVETSDLRLVFERLTGQSLERFFHDWTERPGHPELLVSTDFNPEEKLLRIEAKQTQPAAAFHLPLVIELYPRSQSQPVVLERMMTEKSEVIFVPVTAAPDAVRVDPMLAILADLKEEKSRDLWREQLFSAPGVVERVRAVEHFGESKTDADRELLAKALAEDPFWAVRSEAAEALGKCGGDIARDALIAGLAADHPKARRACAHALGSFASDAKALAALNQKAGQGDASYLVEAAVIGSAAKVAKEPDFNLLVAALDKDSHADVIRAAALGGLRNSSDPKALDTLIEWTKRGKPREARVAAIRAIPSSLDRTLAEDAVRSKTVTAVAGYLDGEGRHVRQAAADVLREMGRAARPAANVLQSLADHDPDGRVRDAAKRALASLRADTPIPSEVKRLHEEIDKLRQNVQSLEERLKR